MEILLLTNRDSDNVGDQVIEASDIALIKAAMKNLGIESSDFKISSRAAAIVTQKYMSTREPALLEAAESAIQKADLIIFGGAPLFNYMYQTFYERTSIELELAQKYHKPVIFSAIGIEHYDEENKKCQRLKAALNLDCVKQITTRDGYDKLEKFRSREDIVIGRVADPAVFSGKVFEKFKVKEKKSSKKTIGLFVLRANGFKDNKYDFSRDQAASLWKELVSELESKGYDYELITSGHFGDEAFVYYLIQNYGINANKCVFNINLPETLLAKISSYDGVISCRLHPSIISFSLGIPSIGLEWNNKVGRFYENIGYPERVIPTTELNAAHIVGKLEQAISEGVVKDKDYLLTVYTTLFQGIKNACYPDADAVPYTYDELMENLPPAPGTSKSETNEKIKRKFRRTYLKYNDLSAKVIQDRAQIAELNAQIKELKKENQMLKKKQQNIFVRGWRWIKRKFKKIFK
jgi:polysaccharide pyruvyl transferase WcaK-like protein